MPQSKIRTRFNAWVERNIIAEDPYPEYSRLDKMNGLGSPELTTEWETATKPTAEVHQFPITPPETQEERLAA